MINGQKRRLRRPVLALVAALLLTFALCSHVAFGDPCASPPPPRFLPGQVDHYPNGADIITCTESPPGHEMWKIDYPSVDRSLTDYPALTFNPGDVVTLDARGCVQSGGFGSTWKRYLNPDDGSGHLDSQYYGTVQIVGVTGDNNPESILHWIGPSFIIPQAGHLALGYVDDGGIGDNGYWNHDDGINNQCVNDDKTTVFIIIDRHAAQLEDCKKAVSFTNTPVAPPVPELERVAELLTDAAEVPVGLPLTKDAQGTGTKHFQLFQDGHRGERTTKSNRPLNSAEMHNDGCVYFAFTPTTAPLWYPADLAFDNTPQKKLAGPAVGLAARAKRFLRLGSPQSRCHQMASHIPSRLLFRRGKFLANERAALDRRLHAVARSAWSMDTVEPDEFPAR
jgi:hypothetical protein